MPSGRPLSAKRKSSMTHYVSQGGRPSNREIERREEGWKEFVSNSGESHIMALPNIVSEYIEEASNLFFEAQNFLFMSLEEKIRSVACDEEFVVKIGRWCCPSKEARRRLDSLFYVSSLVGLLEHCQQIFQTYHEIAYPDDWEVQGKNMILRIVFIVSHEHKGSPREELIVNVDETGIAYNKLAQSGFCMQGEKLSNIANSDKRNATLLACIALSGSLLSPFVIWNGKQGSSHASVKEHSLSVQYQTSNHYTTGAILKYVEKKLFLYYERQVVFLTERPFPVLVLLWDLFGAYFK